MGFLSKLRYYLVFSWFLLSFTVFPSGAPEPDKDSDPELPLRSPVLSSIFPMGGQRGQIVEIEVAGDFLNGASALHCDCDDLKSAIRSGNSLRLKAAIEISASATPGPRFLRVQTPRGFSNRVIFRVSGWETPLEVEPNDWLDQAQEVAVPAVVQARLARVTDSDLYRFKANAGEHLAFNLLVGRNGHFGHLAIALLDERGKEIAHNLSHFGNDPYLSYKFDRTGEYVIAVNIRRFGAYNTIIKDDAELKWQYQLAIGRSPMLWSIFPMGAKRGTSLEAELHADFLDPNKEPEFSGSGVTGKIIGVDPCRCKFRLSIEVAPDGRPGTRDLTFRDPSGNTMRLAFMVSDQDELLEAEPNDYDRPQEIQPPVILNGRIDSRGDRDTFRFHAEQDWEMTFEVDARGLASQMTDPQLALVREEINLWSFGDDRCKSGPGKKCPEYFLTAGKKEKLDSKIVHAFISANPNDADATGTYLLQLFDNSAGSGPGHNYRLSIRKRQPGFRVGVLSDSVAGAVGETVKIPVAALHEEGFNGEIEVTAVGLPEGVHAEPVRIRSGDEKGILQIKDNRDCSGGACRPFSTKVQVIGKAVIGDREISHVAPVMPFLSDDGLGYHEPLNTDVLIFFVEKPSFSLSVEDLASPVFGGFKIDLENASEVTVTVAVKKSASFNLPLEFQPEFLPEGVTVKSVSANENQSRFVLVLAGDPKAAKKGNYRIAIRALAASGVGELAEVTAGFPIRIL